MKKRCKHEFIYFNSYWKPPFFGGFSDNRIYEFICKKCKRKTTISGEYIIYVLKKNKRLQKEKEALGESFDYEYKSIFIHQHQVDILPRCECKGKFVSKTIKEIRNIYRLDVSDLG
jgi:hypothetical protein